MLHVHFLNVGHGDCTLVEHPSGRLTMIDINNSQQFDPESFAEELAEERSKRTPAEFSMIADSLQYFRDTAAVEARAKVELENPIDFVKRNYPDRKIWRFILTHPDLDHMRGLEALAEHVGIINFWDTAHTKETPEFRTDADRSDWRFYQKLRNNQTDTRVLYPNQGASAFAFDFSEDGDRIEVLSPTSALVDECNRREISNDISLVLRVHHGGRSVLLPGDAEKLAWENIRKAYGANLKSDFLKASHHGRDSGFDRDAVKLIAPMMTFVSVGQTPATDASRKYRQATGNKSASTRRYGNIRLDVEQDGNWKWFVDRHAGE